MDTSTIDTFVRVAERLGIPAALVLAGLFFGYRFVAAVGPAAGGFLTKLADKLNEHTVDHVKLDGKLDVQHKDVTGKLDAQHEKTAAAIRQSEQRVRTEVERVRGDLMRAFDIAADRIVDTACRAAPESPPSGHGAHPTVTPVEGTPRTPRSRAAAIANEDTQPSK